MKHTIQEVQLKDGAQGLLIEVPNTNVSNLVAGFNSGNLFCDAKKYPELSHVMEHAMLGANKAYRKRMDFEAEIEKNGAYANAFTSDYFNWYEYEAADYEAPHMIELLAAQLATPLFLKSELLTEVGNVREELNGYLTNYWRVAADQLAHAMIKRPTYEDSLRTLNNITPAVARNYWRRTHTRANMRFIFAGSLPAADRLIKRFESQLRSQPRGRRLVFPSQRPRRLSRPVLVIKDIPQVFYELVQYAHEFPKREEPALVIMNVLLTGRYKSWILGEARERGLAYTVQSGVNNDINLASFSIGAYATPRNIAQLFRLISQKIRKLLDGEVGSKEVDEAKQLLVGRQFRRYKTPEDIINWYYYEFFARDQVYHFNQGIKDIKKVTKQDVTRVAQRLFRQPKWGLSLVGNVTAQKAEQLRAILGKIWQ